MPCLWVRQTHDWPMTWCAVFRTQPPQRKKGFPKTARLCRIHTLSHAANWTNPMPQSRNKLYRSVCCKAAAASSLRVLGYG
ncbi:MAG: hypothetical protein OJF48_001153 [Afipia sp.]|nr:MAG: hypothetical protein OJF48_001153 [Afipia sp.]